MLAGALSVSALLARAASGVRLEPAEAVRVLEEAPTAELRPPWDGLTAHRLCLSITNLSPLCSGSGSGREPLWIRSVRKNWRVCATHRRSLLSVRHTQNRPNSCTVSLGAPARFPMALIPICWESATENAILVLGTFSTLGHSMPGKDCHLRSMRLHSYRKRSFISVAVHRVHLNGSR